MYVAGIHDVASSIFSSYLQGRARQYVAMAAVVAIHFTYLRRRLPSLPGEVVTSLL